MIGQPAFRGTRVFTTEITENTEGQRRKANFVVLKNCFLRIPSVFSVISVVNTRL
jgi:hypothetical protein